MKDFIVMDAETQKHASEVSGSWDNVEAMGLASAVTYSSQLDRYVFWTQYQKDELCQYLNNQIVVTYNGISFDSKLLLGNDRILNKNGVTENDKYKWVNADIYVELWRHILGMDKSDYEQMLLKINEQKFPKNIFNLDSVAYATVGMRKSGKGARAPELFQTKKLLELFQYNLQDVRMTKALYLFINERKYLITGNYDIVSFK
jgi:hypothetical protein